MSIDYATGSSLVGYPVIAKSQRERVDAHTLIDVDDVYDASVRKALLAFDGTLGTLSSLEFAGWFGDEIGSKTATLISFPLGGLSSHVFTLIGHLENLGDETAAVSDAVAVIDQLAGELGVPLSYVLKAAGVKRRTYYSWRSMPSRSPRVASQARLWTFAQIVEDLRDELGSGLRQWVHALPDRLTAIRDGHPDDLISLLWSHEADILQPDLTARTSGLAQDVVVPKLNESVLVDKGRVQNVSLPVRRPH